MTKPKANQAALHGKRVLVTRAEKQAHELSGLLKQHDAIPIEVPFIETRAPGSWEPLDWSLREILDYDWLILTSVNGVAAFFERVQHLGMTSDELQHLKVAAIGPATAKEIEKHGLIVDLVPARYVAEEVVRALRDKVDGERILLVRAKVARDVIPHELGEAGAQVDVREAYETILPEGSQQRLLDVLEGDRPDAITFTSSSTVENMMKMAVGTRIPSLLSGITFAAIGPVTAATLRDYALPVHVEAEDFTMAGLVRALEAYFKKR